MSRERWPLLSLLVILLLTAACRFHRGAGRAPAIGEAFVAPPTLKVRADFPYNAPTVATLKHGDRVEILRRHRRVFMRVRTASGAEGWVDDKQLLSAADLARLKDLAERASKLPLQGQATADRNLNVYMAPSRESPTFLQLKEKEKVDVVAHIVAQRVAIPREPLITPPPKKVPGPPKPAKEPKVPPPPMPKPPPPPQNWMELSKAPEDEDEEPEPEKPPKPIPTDEWSLIRTSSGETGWVLRRFLTLAIPDEVAQYAEGRRIVAYQSLGEVQDGDVKKSIWVWTTVSGRPGYDFESFRVFIWSVHRHRYETAYIERNLEGYLPLLKETVEYGGAKYPGFSVCVAKDDGRHRKSYALLTNIIRYAGDRPCQPQPELYQVAQNQQPASASTQLQPQAQAPEAPPKESLVEKVKNRLKGIFKKKG